MGRRPSTRERLQAAALDLFLAQGYEETTVNQVAQAAGVSHMTFFRHFPTKEDVVLDDPYDEVIAGAVRAQDRGLPVVERVRCGILAAWAALPEPSAAQARARVGLVARTPRLRARAAENNRRTASLICEALVADGAAPVDAAVAAAACLAALMEALLLWGAQPDSGDLGTLIRRALDVLAVGADAGGRAVASAGPA
ncbi:TetR/AcrR family transcriptional regulator [Cellulomonas gilvus]|nr:TetR/AcrR family transcriptional regulator [Cellulomonas gilvus]